MMLKSYMVLFACCILILSSCDGLNAIEKQEHFGNRGTYVHCNVYLGTACFGVRSGDEMQMSIPVDFVLYEVRSGDNWVAIIYLGFHANIENPALRDQFEICTESEETCMFVSENEAEIEAVYSGSRKEKIVHILLSNINQTNKLQAREFIENFRPCKRADNNLMCRDEAIFTFLPNQ